MQQTVWTQLDLLLPSPSKRVSPTETSDTDEEAHRRRIVGFLTVRMPDPVDLVFTTNHSTMISFARRQGRYRVRLHRMFRHADTAMLEHLARFILGRRNADSTALDQFIDDHKDEINRERKRRRRLREQGAHHDLKAILAKVADEYFGHLNDVRIGWGTAPKRQGRQRQRRTITRALATYSYDDQTIRVSPVLDRPEVPGYVMEWIIYHEMLHHVLPIEKSGGRNHYHTRKFRMLERAFKDFEKAKRWEDNHLEMLLR